MATHDVPGANPANADELATGCWAEHEDGSLIFVKSTENDQVVYEIYDMSQDPPVYYNDAMPIAGFERTFSYPPTGGSGEKWTWHDKTPFPFDRVMQRVKRPQPQYADPEDTLNAAQRIVQSRLNLRAQRVTEESLRHRTPETANRAHAIIDKLATALKELID